MTFIGILLALLAERPASTDRCLQLKPEWSAVAASEPVFISAAGLVNGTVVLSRPVAPGTTVTPQNVPEWLLTYPEGVDRVQFIAHYRIVTRVLPCEDRVIGTPG